MGVPKDLVSIPEFAKIIGVSQERVRRVVKTGRLTTYKEGRFIQLDPKTAKKEWMETKTETSSNKNPSGKKKDSTKTKIVTKVEVAKFDGMTTADAERKEKVYRAKLSELKYLEQAGSLLKKDDVQRHSFESARKVRDSMLGIPARFAHELAVETDPYKLENHLLKIITKALEQGMRGEND